MPPSEPNPPPTSLPPGGEPSSPASAESVEAEVHPAPSAPSAASAPGNAPPWRIWEALALVGLFFGAQLLFSGAASALLGLIGLDGESGLDMDRIVLYSLPVGLLASYSIGGALVYWLLARRHRLALSRALALAPYPPHRLLGPFAAGFALQLAVTVAVTFYPPPPGQEFLFDLFVRGGPWAIGFFFVVAVVLAPAMEEVMFRGLLLPALMGRVGFPLAALGVTALFTVLHTFQMGFYLPALIGIFTCGWLLAHLRVSRGSLWPPLAFHMGFNFAAFLPLMLGE